MASSEKVKAVTSTMIHKYDSNMNLEDVHTSTDAKTPVAQNQGPTDWGKDMKEVK